MTDLTNWLSWFRRECDLDISDEDLMAIYDNYYSCTCESCEQRKALGMMPVKLSHKCTTPLSPLSVEYVITQIPQEA